MQELLVLYQDEAYKLVDLGEDRAQKLLILSQDKAHVLVGIGQNEAHGLLVLEHDKANELIILEHDEVDKERQHKIALTMGSTRSMACKVKALSTGLRAEEAKVCDNQS